MILKLDTLDRKSAARYGLRCRCWRLRCWVEESPLEVFLAGRWSTWTISLLSAVCWFSRSAMSRWEAAADEGNGGEQGREGRKGAVTRTAYGDL